MAGRSEPVTPANRMPVLVVVVKNSPGKVPDSISQGNALKRRELQEKGIELSNLLIAVARTKNGFGTAVLVVTTDTGDFVLDQATDDIKIWSAIPYEFLKRQANENSGVWLRIEDQRKLD